MEEILYTKQTLSPTKQKYFKSVSYIKLVATIYV